MGVLVIGRGTGETWFVSLSLTEMQQYATTLSPSLFTVYIFTPPSFSLCRPRSHLISALPSKRQGADKPFLWYKQEIYGEVNLT